jgi:hypothetical protein
VFRKFALLGSAIAICAGTLFVGGVAHAGSTSVDASHYTVGCDSLQKGSMSFSPPFMGGGAHALETVHFKGTLNGCDAVADGSDPAVTVLSGSISGSLSGGDNNCTSVDDPSLLGGYLTVTWKTSPPLKNSKSTIIVAPFETSAHSVFPFNDFAAYRQMDFSGVTVTGAFAGNDGGKSTVIHMLSTEGFDYTFGTCASPTGLKGLGIGSTEFALQ